VQTAPDLELTFYKGRIMEITLTTTAEGEFALGKEVLEHLGARPGDRLQVDLIPSGRIQLRMKPHRDNSSKSGLLDRPDQRALTVGEMNDAVASGAAAGAPRKE
jgi:hypothetical protein